MPRCAASQVPRDAVRKPWQAAVPVDQAARRRASKSLADAVHRLRLPSYPTGRLVDPYGSLSSLVGIRTTAESLTPNANRLHRRATRPVEPQTGQRHPAHVRPLRFLHRDVPDLRPSRRRARQSARPHLHDQGSAGKRPPGDAQGDQAYRPLPELPVVHDHVPVRRRLYAPGRRCPCADRGDLPSSPMPSATTATGSVIGG